MKLPFCGIGCFSCTSETAIDTTRQGGESTRNKFRVFYYNELKAATNGFSESNKIGGGGFGYVYKGWLQDGTVAAIKVLSVELGSMRGEKEFVAELAALSNIKHENLVTLRGCCINGDSRYLVYDYMKNNSIAQTLLGREQNRKKFGWEARRKISFGVARGIAYLHEEVEPHIVHRDIKAGNILLDENFTPKVSDFGLSKLLRDNKSHVSTRVAGTFFGVLLLEIISGKEVVAFDLEHGENYLVQKAWDAYNANNLVELVDSALGTNYPEEEAVLFLKVGLLCVQETAKRRPQMSVVVQMLTHETDIGDVQISHPGLVADLMDIKLDHKDFYESSKGTSLESTHSPHSSTYF
ncbi:putative serine/threonine-protein kinase isoform X2 [Carica papaya]|uniref:putative serine/threonine-protein kinase isoform X2 n=1 Tax=Carica papaya TaxID=3649 RepID=UPI000B8D0CBF|nr:putative serine/threonine-protein kinase isoform X2 [Carica papaya]